jgi:molybdenum cofactor cytidylyltransferase
MVAPGDIAVILLAAGKSSRFGRPKLSALLGGKPVAHHAASMLAECGFGWRIGIIGPDTPPLAVFGFQEIPLDPPGAPQSRSLALGIEAAARTPAKAALVALADMPLVPFTHIQAMLASFDGQSLASAAGETPLPPALFGRALFPDLQALTGDRGAAPLLRSSSRLTLPEDCALDIDTEEDLARAEVLLDRHSG